MPDEGQYQEEDGYQSGDTSGKKTPIASFTAIMQPKTHSTLVRPWALWISCAIIVTILCVVPGLLCYFRYYLPDRSCDNFANAIGTVTLEWVPPDSGCCTGFRTNCAPCFIEYGKLSYQNETSTIQCDFTITIDTDFDRDALVARANTSLGTSYPIAYDRNNLTHCYLDHCERSCDNWRAAFWVPSFVVICVLFACILLCLCPKTSTPSSAGAWDATWR